MTYTQGSPLFAYLGGIAEGENQPPVDAVLRQLTDYFDASAIGVCCALTLTTLVSHEHNSAAVPEKFAWQADLGLVERARLSLSALAHQDGTGNWLLGVAWEPHQGEPLLVWLYRAQKGPWSKSDAALWPIAAQVLVRCMAQQSDRLSAHLGTTQKLESVARVASRLSHDFGNYLTGILGFTELSLAQAPGHGLLSRYLQEVLQAAKQGSEWIRRLHWFCRRNGQSSWPTELSSVLEDVQIRLCLGALVRWEKRVPGDLPLLAIDPGPLQALLTELVNNTYEVARTTQKACTLTFSARGLDLSDADCRTMVGSPRAGRFVEIRVSDDGPGIAPEVRAKIFSELFFSTKPRHRGLGFLAVYGILHRFGGGLRIGDGAAPQGSGACVDVYIPAASIAPAPAPAETSSRILVVHPDPLLFESLRRILEFQGYRVTVALTAQAALGVYQAEGPTFALVLAEALLNELSGFDLARRILDRDPHANFIFLYTQPSFHGLAEEEMLKRFPLLRWPLETSVFVQAVRNALARVD